MLEQKSPKQIDEILSRSSTAIKSIDLCSVAPGTIIKAETSSGNYYLLEITDPSIPKAHIVRGEPRERAPRSGYRGERIIRPRVISIDKQIFHGKSSTSLIVKLFIL